MSEVFTTGGMLGGVLFVFAALFSFAWCLHSSACGSFSELGAIVVKLAACVRSLTFESCPWRRVSQGRYSQGGAGHGTGLSTQDHCRSVLLQAVLSCGWFVPVHG